MKLGMRLYELWRLRVGLVTSLLLASVVSVFSAYNVTVAPPGLHPRAMGMAAASVHVLVDNSHSVLLNLGLGSTQLDQMSQRALLLGNVMASLPVREDIARRAGVPADLIEMSAPLTPQYPRPLVDDNFGSRRRTTDLVRSNNQYRINIKANPTVPMLDIYTEASSVATAKALANAAVAGLGDYLNAVADSQNVSAAAKVRLEQLGPAEGGGVTGSVNVEVVLLSFLFVFSLSSVGSLVLARVVRGWRLAQKAEKPRIARADARGSRAGQSLDGANGQRGSAEATVVSGSGARAGQA